MMSFQYRLVVSNYILGHWPMNIERDRVEQSSLSLQVEKEVKDSALCQSAHLKTDAFKNGRSGIVMHVGESGELVDSTNLSGYIFGLEPTVLSTYNVNASNSLDS